MELEVQHNDFIYQELFTYLAKTYKASKEKIAFPTQVSALETFYDKELFPQIRQDLHNKFPQLNSWDPFEVDTLLEHQILNALKSRNFYKLKKFIYENIAQFLDKFDICTEYEVNEVHKFLEDNLEHNDQALSDIAEAFKKKEKFDHDPTFQRLNERIQMVYIVLVVHQQLMYFKYEMSDLYFAGSHDIKKGTITQIMNRAILDYPTVIRNTQKTLKNCVNGCLKEFKQTFETNLTAFYEKNPKVVTYAEAYKGSNNYLSSILKENATEKLGSTPTEAFLMPYNDEINETVKDSVIHDRLHKYLMQDTLLFQNTIYKELTKLFNEFSFVEGVAIDIFDDTKLGGRGNMARLFSIVLLTDYLELDESRFEIYFEKLQLIYLYYGSSLIGTFPVLNDYFNLINSRQKCLNNKSMIKHHLELERNKWRETVNESQNLYAMTCIFLAFSQVQTGKHLSSKKYSSHDRFMIKNIFRSLRNGEDRFTNFQILCAMESFTTEPPNDNDTPIGLPNAQTGILDDILKKIRDTTVKSISEHKIHENQLAHLHDKISPHIKKPSKFFLEKISDKNIRSKVINICVSGFTSEDKAKAKEWRSILQANPYTETFALHWNSNTLSNLFQFLLKEGKEIGAANAGLLPVVGVAFPPLRPILLTMATYQAFKGVKDDLWGKTYEEAINTGIYLAHILSETDLFKDHVINFVGFSLGTLVVMSCIWELERMGKHDIVYDVLLTGGVVNAGDFNKRALKVVGNKIINCYCRTDYILKFLLKIVSYSTNPIGLGPILCAHKKVENIDVGRKVDGHTDYRKHLDEVLTQVDFNEDLNYLLTE